LKSYLQFKEKHKLSHNTQGHVAFQHWKNNQNFFWKTLSYNSWNGCHQQLTLIWYYSLFAFI